MYLSLLTINISRKLIKKKYEEVKRKKILHIQPHCPEATISNILAYFLSGLIFVFDFLPLFFT